MRDHKTKTHTSMLMDAIHTDTLGLIKESLFQKKIEMNDNMQALVNVLPGSTGIIESRKGIFLSVNKFFEDQVIGLEKRQTAVGKSREECIKLGSLRITDDEIKLCNYLSQEAMETEKRIINLEIPPHTGAKGQILLPYRYTTPLYDKKQKVVCAFSIELYKTHRFNPIQLRQAYYTLYDNPQSAHQQFLKHMVGDKHYHEFNAIKERELECLIHLATGKTMKLVAHELGLSNRTVEFHVVNLKEKLNCYSLAELCALYWKSFRRYGEDFEQEDLLQFQSL